VRAARDEVRERLEADGDPCAAVRAVVGEVQRGLVVHPPRLHLGQRVTGDQAAGTEAADHQRGVAPAGADHPVDRVGHRAGVVQQRGAAVVEAQQDHVEAQFAQAGQERVAAAVQPAVEGAVVGGAGAEAVGDDDRPHQSALGPAVVDPRRAAGHLPGRVGRRHRPRGLRHPAERGGDREPRGGLLRLPRLQPGHCEPHF
jgi:hypothetical protein